MLKKIKDVISNDKGFSTPEVLGITVLTVIAAMIVFNAVKDPVDDVSNKINGDMNTFNNLDVSTDSIDTSAGDN